MGPQRKCRICNSAIAKYKCPTCLTPFCSVGCGKVHKEAVCAKPVTESAAEENEKTGAGGAIFRSDGHGSKLARSFPRDEEEENRLTEEQCDTLLSNTAVGVAVRDPKLQDVIRRIDSAQDPVTALQREMQDPDFEEFANVLLDAIGATSDPEEERMAKVDRARTELQKLLAGEGEG